MKISKEYVIEICKRVRSSKKSIVVAISFALFTDMIAYGVILPIIPVVMEKEFDKPESITGLLFAMFSAGCLIGTPIVGIVSDRIGRRTPFIIGMSMLAASTMLFAYGKKWLAVLFIARFIQGLSSSVAWVIGLALISDIYSNQEFGTVSGIVIGGNTIGAMVGPIIGGVTYEHWGYLVPFYITGVFVVLDLLARILLVDDSYIKIHKQLKDVKSKEIINLIKNNQITLLDGANNIPMDIIKSSGINFASGLNSYNYSPYHNNQDPIEVNTSVEQQSQELDNEDQLMSSVSTIPTINTTLPAMSDKFTVETTKYSPEMASIAIDQDPPLSHGGAILITTPDISGAEDHTEFDDVPIRDEEAVKSTTTVPMNELQFYKLIIKRVDVWLTLSSIIVFGIGMSALEPLLPLLVTNKFHKDNTNYTAGLFGTFIAPFLILSPIAGFLTDNNYVTRTKMSSIGALVTAIAFPFIDKVPRLFLLYIVIAVIGGGLAVFFNPIIPILTYVVDPEERGNNNAKILSLFCLTYSFGIFIGPIYSTLLVEHLSFFAFTMSFSVIIFVNSAAFLIYFFSKPTSKFQASKITLN